MERNLTIDAGGRLNKYYNELAGTLSIRKVNNSLLKIIKKAFRNNINYELIRISNKELLNSIVLPTYKQNKYLIKNKDQDYRRG